MAAKELPDTITLHNPAGLYPHPFSAICGVSERKIVSGNLCPLKRERRWRLQNSEERIPPFQNQITEGF
jgi:hypothetical protein